MVAFGMAAPAVTRHLSTTVPGGIEKSQTTAEETAG